MIPKIMDDTKALTELVTDKTCIGRLAECTSAIISEERNGAYTLELEVPMSAKYYSELHVNGILKVKANQDDDEQLFRIESISEPYGDTVTVNANHISYDLSKVSVLPCTAIGADKAVEAIKSNMLGGSSFEIATTWQGTTGTFKNLIPQPARSLFGGQSGSLIDVYGGEWHFDNLTCNLMRRRGTDRSVQLRYGKNITSIEQETNIESMYTHVQPYSSVQDANAIVGTLHELKNVSSDNMKIYNLDLSDKFSDLKDDDGNQREPTVEEIDKACDTYIKANDLTTPKVSIELEYVNLADIDEYKDLFLSEKIALCDTVHIYFPKLNINASAKVVSSEWNVLKERYEKLEIGDARSTLASTVADISSEAKSYTDSQLNQSSVYTKGLFDNVNKELKDVDSAVDDLNKEVESIATDGIVTEAEKASVNKMLQVVEKEKTEADEKYNDLIANVNLTGTAKTNLTTAYNSAFGGTSNAYKTLITKINAILNATTAEEVNTALTAYKQAYNAYTDSVKEYELRISQAQLSISSLYTDNAIEKAYKELDTAMSDAVTKIKKASGGKTVLHDSTDDSNDIVRNELYAYDGDTLATSSKVLRINNAGIAGTDDGINGTYHVAITTDGYINADYINAGTLKGINIVLSGVMYFYQGTSYQGTFTQSNATYTDASGNTKTYYGAKFITDLFDVRSNMILLQNQSYTNASIHIFENYVEIGEYQNSDGAQVELQGKIIYARAGDTSTNTRIYLRNDVMQLTANQSSVFNITSDDIQFTSGDMSAYASLPDMFNAINTNASTLESFGNVLNNHASTINSMISLMRQHGWIS